MARPLGDVVIENEDTDEEERVFLVEIHDPVTQKIRNGLDVYDSHNRLMYRVGYKTGMVEVDGQVFNGDTFTTTSASDKRRIADCEKRAFHVEESEDGE